jgi:hypothetical protein
MADQNKPHTLQDHSDREEPTPGRPSSKPQTEGALTGSSDQDFSQRPGFGGYGADGGGYGAQTSYGSHSHYRAAADSSGASNSNSAQVTRRTGTGATSSHTGTGTQTQDTATGASHGSTFGGATTSSEEVTNGETSKTDTAARQRQ